MAIIDDPVVLDTALSTAIRLCVEWGKVDAATALARSRLVRVDDWTAPDGGPRRTIHLDTDPSVKAILDELNEEREVGDDMWPAELQYVFANVDPPVLPLALVFPELSITATEAAASNQGRLHPGKTIQREGIRYRSHTEARVAAALDSAGVLYFPLPIAIRHHVRFEPDFLVVSFGKIGILEVDGPHHTDLTRAREDARAAWFQKSGIRLVRHYPVRLIDDDADGVIRNFLAHLRGPSV